MTKPVRIGSIGIRQEKWSKFSAWAPVCQFEQCCDCGSVHQMQYKVHEKGGKYVIRMRVKRAIGRTKLARRRELHEFTNKITELRRRAA